jgi:hypothetical protein
LLLNIPRQKHTELGGNTFAGVGLKSGGSPP